jgi:FAD/FMN-containing dehydrogenase
VASDAVTAFLRELDARLGAGGYVTDPDVVATHVVDWTGRWRGHSPAVVRPDSTTEVAAVITAARTHGVELVAQGGNTGLVGGSTPRHGEVVVDLRRLHDLGPVDEDAAQVTVGAGATLADVQAHVAPHGLALGVDLASRDTATVGGMVATNAGGVHVVRHGSMRAQVLGVEAVLGTGAVLHANLDGLVKDNTGYDLPGLLCGSEGTLGLVTAVRLRLVPIPEARAVAWIGLAHLGVAVAVLPTLRRLPGLHAVEAVDRAAIGVVAAHLRQAPPVADDAAWGLLVEVVGDGDGPLEELAAALKGPGQCRTAEVGGLETQALFVREGDDLNGKGQAFAALRKPFDGGDGDQDAQRAVVLAGIAHTVEVAAQEKCRSVFASPRVAAAQIANGVGPDDHACPLHPARYQFPRVNQ